VVRVCWGGEGVLGVWRGCGEGVVRVWCSEDVLGVVRVCWGYGEGVLGKGVVVVW
jgi:hypothetical protein